MDSTGLTARDRFVRFIFALLAVIFAVCIVIQVFLAGLGLFLKQGNFELHTAFIHYFEFVPIVMFAISFVGRLSRGMRMHSIGLLIMILLQYVTIKAFSGVWVAALHPVIAVFLFWSTMILVKNSWGWLAGKLDS